MERKLYFVIGTLWTVVVLAACLLSSETIAKAPRFDIPYKDKLAHFTFYFVFSVIWFKYYVKSNPNTSRIKLSIRIFTIASLMGGIVEVLQYYFTASRSAEWADELANCLGSLFGVLLCLTLFRRKK
ncbi:VanZ family protein [Myroides marinus]|uniref:VanZ family protein n=1 Tax=Myroides marinus TaxID=703342 RepID=UPI002577A868|nr:VanZ family protein [Myroides marinus]MDM1367216.1 VanZ family protein [Myroides marinus]MDM1374444.1 VanZ family protein [Myroides marinus]MDM1381599.1 VanZ family protein [Myroides marinus]